MPPLTHTTPDRPTDPANLRPHKRARTRPPLPPGTWTLAPRALVFPPDGLAIPPAAIAAPSPAAAAAAAFDELCLATN